MKELRIKLLIDTRGKRVAFAEAGKDFVDFLFRILSLPVAGVVGLLGNEAKVGSLVNLHGSIENLKDYILPTTKDAILKSSENFSPAKPNVKRLYRCGELECHDYEYKLQVSDDPNTACPSCGNKMWMKVRLVTAAAGGGVNGLVSYMVMDDLTIMPLSITSTFTLLKKLNVKSVADMEEKVVHLGMDEALKLLDASLQSKNVLTDVFLKDSNTPDRTAGVKRERTSY